MRRSIFPGCIATIQSNGRKSPKQHHRGLRVALFQYHRLPEHRGRIPGPVFKYSRQPQHRFRISGTYSNTNGSSNTVAGDIALYSNTTGYHNTASGAESLHSNATGSSNAAFGLQALYSNTTGSNNIALGTGAGFKLTSGSGNIEIGNQGTSADHGIIRIGTSGTQTAAFIAGIENAKVTGSAVYVTSSGQLGVLASSERYKTAISPMGSGTQKLQQLRPVTFHLKTQPGGTLQYGLIAEEVAQVYPELVTRDESGTIQGVRYDELAPMLLNEVQQQRRTLAAQEQKLQEMERQLAHLQQLKAAMRMLPAADGLVTGR
jgi:endosialidase-like protein